MRRPTGEKEEPPELDQMIEDIWNTAKAVKNASRAVEEGAQDVYLPNDSHWGSQGQRLAGQQVINSLRKH